MVKLIKKQCHLTMSWLFISVFLLIISLNYYPANPYQPKSRQEIKIIEQLTSAEPIQINKADLKDLMKLKGVGHKRAQQIIDYRKKHGKFRSWDDIKRVPGVGTRLYYDNKRWIIIK